MEHISKKDIFISYKNDGSGNQFAARLCQDLEAVGYSVYFNSNEERGHSFPERLKAAVAGCRDFILILSAGCLAQLRRNDPVDWVREEVLTAHALQKHIIPILMEGVDLPKDANEMPECLRFLPHVDAIRFPEQYLSSPFSVLINILHTKKNGSGAYQDLFNSNPHYRVKEDFLQIRQAAQEGNVQAMYELGMMYFYGVTDETGTVSGRNSEQAYYWLKKVSQMPSDLRYHADNCIARLYYRGDVPQEAQSYEQAYQLHKAAAAGDANSAIEQAYMQRVGLGCNFDYQSIVDFYKANIQKGDDQAILALGKFYAKYGKFREAIELFDSLALVSPEADYQMGLIYRDGVISDPPKPDYIQAAYYFRNAADNNHIMAAFEYGRLCFAPTGRFRKNFANAEKYFKIAADNGVSDAQYFLGFMYDAGHVTKCRELAVEYYEKAYAQGHSQAALELAKQYQEPECQNYQRAFECARVAAAHGAAEGELILGNLLFWGRGCQADMNKAYEMYSRAYQHGMFYASVMMKKIDNIRNSR